MNQSFPKGFLWGAATSAYQVEGGLDKADWAKLYPAGSACEHWNRYKQDFELLTQLNLNTYRLSVDWSRIEPEPGRFDRAALEHYRQMLQALKARGLTTMVTLHHFTSPAWLRASWLDPQVVARFTAFSRIVFEALHELVDFWIPLNEPLVYSSHSYFLGKWPPQRKSLWAMLRVTGRQLKAHRQVYKLLHKLNPKVRVGIAKHNSFFEPASPSWPDRLAAALHSYLWNRLFLNRVRHQLDFIGLNYYFHNKLKFPNRIINDNKLVSDLGWEIYPEGLFHCLKELARYNLPIYITENGLADAQDKLRQSFIHEHLAQVLRAINAGVNVRGYLHWSLLDNFEWADGFKPRFGLVAVDYSTQLRAFRSSALYYAQIAKTNRLA